MYIYIKVKKKRSSIGINYPDIRVQRIFTTVSFIYAIFTSVLSQFREFWAS